MFKTRKIIFHLFPKIRVYKNLAIFQKISFVCLTDCLLKCWKMFLNQNNTFWSKEKQSNGKENKTRCIGGQMVIFDFFIMMPTLSINSISFLNQTFLSFCLVSKTTWKLATWSLPTLQKSFQTLIWSIQTWNVQTERRSPPQFENPPNHHHLANLCIQRHLRHYLAHSSWQNSNFWILCFCGQLVEHLAGRNHLKHKTL